MAPRMSSSTLEALTGQPFGRGLQGLATADAVHEQNGRGSVVLLKKMQQQNGTNEREVAAGGRGGSEEQSGAHIFRVHVELVEDGLASAVVNVQFNNNIRVWDRDLLHNKLCTDGLVDNMRETPKKREGE